MPGPTEESKQRWILLKDEYFEGCMSGKVLLMGDLAKKYGFSPQSVRNRSSRDGWPAQIQKLKEQREILLGEKLTERTTIVLDKLNDEFATTELEVRKRHAFTARSLQVRAVNRLKDLPLEAFSPKDALAMLKLGLEEERKALGMPEVYVPQGDTDNHPEYKSVAEQVGGHRQIQRVGLELLKSLREKIQDAEYTDIESVGLGNV